MAAANHLDRNVDEDRVRSLDGHSTAEVSHHTVTSTDAFSPEMRDKIARVLSISRGYESDAKAFLDGFPERYVSTRTPEIMAQHFQMTLLFEQEPFQLAFQHGTVSEITLVTQDRPRLFAGMAAALAAWGMNVVTADAFANSSGVVVDTFRFTDTFRTLELNQSERERFVSSVRDLVAGRASAEKLLSSRRRARRKAPRVVVETTIDFDNTASAHSTLLQIVAQDIPGLLRAISMTLSTLGYNLEIALIDTEGEMAIDVFYVTRDGAKLDSQNEAELRTELIAAIEQNAA
jgi:[protein-PII] uridylyltransferase